MTEDKRVCYKCDTDLKWYDFMFHKDFQFFMMGVKIIAAVALIAIVYLVYTEIEAVKFLNYDQCEYCMEKTGALCFLGYNSQQQYFEVQERKIEAINNRKDTYDFNLSEIIY